MHDRNFDLQEDFMYKFILASKSPRRKEILNQVGVEFTVIPSDNKEVVRGRNPEEIVKDLAVKKALDVSYKMNEPAIIIAADTVVVHDGKILGKPADEADAKRMLRSLQSNTHKVYTGVAIVLKGIGEEDRGTKVIQFSEETKVSIGWMSEKQIESYVETKEPMDKAGAYAIQGKFAIYVKKIEGDFYNVVGFPVARFYQTLLSYGIDPIKDSKKKSVK